MFEKGTGGTYLHPKPVFRQLQPILGNRKRERAITLANRILKNPAHEHRNEECRNSSPFFTIQSFNKVILLDFSSGFLTLYAI